MSKTEGFHILDTQNVATIGDTTKKAAALRPQNVVRRKLADISNLPQSQRPAIHEEKSKSIETSTKEYMNQLQRENVALVKMLAQRNKIIEHNGIELDRLRVNLLKMQEQNQQLAISNTQMLAELNSGKDRLKLLHHELGWKNGLLKARKIELEGARTEPCKKADVELVKTQEEVKPLKEGINDEKPQKTKRNLDSNGLSLSNSEHDQSKDKVENKRQSLRRQSARFKPADVKPAEDFFETITEVSITQLPDEKQQTVNKRPYARRQSARLKSAEVKPAEDTTETNSTKIYESQLPEDTFQEQGSTSESALLKDESNLANSVPKSESQEFGRPSLSRPSRVAAKKVQSYKEVPLNVKMRR